MLLKTRQWLLEKHASVKLAREALDLSVLVQHQAYDLAILYHTLKPEERQNAIDLLATFSPDSKIICLVPIFEQPVPDIAKGDCIPTDSSAQALVRRVIQILEPTQTGFPA